MDSNFIQCMLYLGTCEASIQIRIGRPIRFESDGPIRKFSNRIGRACRRRVVRHLAASVIALKAMIGHGMTKYKHIYI